MRHPLINKTDSSHYDSTGKPAIVDFEERYTVEELMVWAKITKAKYDHPARAAKGQIEADKRKSDTYESYYIMLSLIYLEYSQYRHIPAAEAYNKLGYVFDFERIGK